MKKRLSMTVKQHPVLCLILFVQIVLLLYLNLFKLDHFLGYDCSAYYLQAMEMGKQLTLFPSHWEYQTTLQMDSPVLLAAALYAVTKNIFISYGISMTISVMLFILVIGIALKQLSAKTMTKLIAFIVLLTPYCENANSSNNLSYYWMMFFSFGAYITKISLIIWICITFLTIEKIDESIVKKSVFIAISIVSCIFTGLCSGIYILIFAIAPIVVYWTIRNIRNNAWKRRPYITEAIFLGTCACAQVIGKLLAKNHLGFESRDSITILTTLENFWENLQSIFLGFLKLLGALPTNTEVQVLSEQGIGFLVRLCFGVLLFMGAILVMIKKTRESYETPFAFWSTFFIINVLIFIPIYTTYGAAIFEERYLIPAFTVLTILFSEWINEQQSNSNQSVVITLNIITVACLVVTNFICFGNVFNSQNQFEQLEQVKEAVASYDSPVVFAIGPDVGIIGRNMRVYDSSKIYKYSEDGFNPHHWGDYTYYDDASEYTGSTLVLTTSSFFETLPEYFTKNYTLVHEFPDADIKLYYADSNPFDFVTGMQDRDYALDFVYSPGMQVTENGNFDADGNFITNGNEGYAVWGPYCTITREGVYDIVLNYETDKSENNEVGLFDASINEGADILQQTQLNKEDHSVVLHSVKITKEMMGRQLEYRVYVKAGSIVKIKSVEIKRLGGET